MAKENEVCIISKHTIKPSARLNTPKKIHLTPFDLQFLSMDYIQQGILFNKPQDQSIESVISNLLSSFSRAIDYYHPLGGRLATTDHKDENSISICLECNDQGAEFIHASASHITVSDILIPCYTPTIVYSFFAMNNKLGHDGHAYPLISAQITELADAIFIGCSLNHCIGDGTSFWNLFNLWSDICRNGSRNISVEIPLQFDRWFPDFLSPPIRLPFTDTEQFIREGQAPPVRKCVFNFSSENIKKLKAKANDELKSDNKISSLQALLAHTWRSVTRARRLAPHQETTYVLAVGYRARMNPPLPNAYLGNCVIIARATALAGDIAEKGLGWTAMLLNQAVALQNEARAHEWVRSWAENPSFLYYNQTKVATNVVTGSSPRFDVYGNDFGWGRPLAVRSGPANKNNGMVTVYPGCETGSMMLEICLSAEALCALLEDNQFMEVIE